MKNSKHYVSRFRFWSQLAFTLTALAVSILIMATGHLLLGLVMLSLFSFATARPTARLCVATLSVPELLQDVMEAFKLETPEVFGPNGFGTDFSSQTAVLGDKITAHIALLPATANYDPTPGVGFYSGVQNAETLLQDVPVTLSSFVHCPVRVKYLTQLSSKLPLYKEAIRNIGYSLGKKVVDSALAQIVGNFSNKIVINPANISLDSIEAIRSQLNVQKAMGKPRWGLTNTPFAAALQNDDRVKSSLFYGTLNGDEGYRLFRSLSGMSWIKEYPDFSLIGNNIQAIFGDRRAIAIATRKPDFSNAAAQLGATQVMQFFPMSDPMTGLQMVGVMWQEAGTGDVIVSAAILFGIGAGNQGGANGTLTDNAAVVVTSA